MKTHLFLCLSSFISSKVWASSPSFFLPENLLTAASLWSGDVAQVTNFLDEADNITTENFRKRASTALTFEREELKWKDMIDQALADDPSIQSANNTLVTQGTFGLVVGLLEEMAEDGTAAIGNVDKINQVRCASVLPSIDIYFKAVTALNAGAQAIVAARPDKCVT